MVHSYIFQRQIEEINHELEDLKFGLMRLMIGVEDGKELHETIIKDDFGKEYIVSENTIKVIKNNGQDFEAVELDSDNEEFIETLENLKILVMGLKSSGIADCCIDLQSIALRPEFAKNIINIIEPQNIEECYEIEILVGEKKYKLIDDGCPHIVEIAGQNDQEHVVILSPSELIEVVPKINEIINPIIESKEFAQAEIIELNKDLEMQQKLIEATRIKLTLMPAIVDKSEEGDFLIKPIENNYLILPENLSVLDVVFEPVVISTKLGRLMFKAAIDEINQACEIILNNAEALKSCYEAISRFSKIDNKPTFILENFDEKNKDYFMVDIDDKIFAIHKDDRGCILVFYQKFAIRNLDDNYEDLDIKDDFEMPCESLSVKDLPSFIEKINNKISEFNNSLLKQE